MSRYGHTSKDMQDPFSLLNDSQPRRSFPNLYNGAHVLANRTVYPTTSGRDAANMQPAAQGVL